MENQLIHETSPYLLQHADSTPDIEQNEISGIEIYSVFSIPLFLV